MKLRVDNAEEDGKRWKVRIRGRWGMERITSFPHPTFPELGESGIPRENLSGDGVTTGVLFPSCLLFLVFPVLTHVLAVSRTHMHTHTHHALFHL